MRIRVILAIIPLLVCLTACGDINNMAGSIDNDTTINSDTYSSAADTTTDSTTPESFCPLGNYAPTPARVMAPAYAPYLLEVDEHNYQHIEIEPECGPAYGFSFELPTGWRYEGSQTEDDPTGHIITVLLPQNSDTPVITIEYNSGGVGVCGTDLIEKTIDFNGHTATQGFFNGDEMWGFIALDGDYNGCIIKMNDSDLYNEYAEDVDLILQTLNFRFYEANVK